MATKSIKQRLSPARLRWAVLLLLVTILVPLIVLMFQTQRQLKWEAFYQHRVLAEQVARTIAEPLNQAILKMESYSYNDYQFFIDQPDDQSIGLVQRSNLANYPVVAEIPGLLGYFQVDEQGRFSSPLLPSAALTSFPNLTISDYDARQDLQNQLLNVLSDNRLVRKTHQDLPIEEIAVISPEPQDYSTGKNFDLSGSLGASSAAEAVPEIQESATPTVFADAPESVTPEYAESAKNEGLGVAQSNRNLLMEEDAELYSQSVFDELNQRQIVRPDLARKQKSAAPAQSRLEDLELNKEAFQKAREQELRADKTGGKSSPAASPAAEKKASRKRQTLVVENLLTQDAATEADRQPRPDPVQRIRIFESELDPYTLARLDSGEFVLFRKVWREGKRLIQGAIIQPETFIKAALVEPFLQSQLAGMSSMVVAFQGDVLTLASGREPDSYSAFGRSAGDVKGDLLHQGRLSAPLEGFEMVWTIKQLPVSQGARIIVWSSIALVAVILLGFAMLYRLGIKQIVLGRQQQDFISAVSHELKTPLTSIRMYGEMLKEGWVTGDKQQEYYHYIYDESERLSRLIANVLQLARLERNEIKLEPGSFEVAQLVDLIRSKIDAQLTKAGFNCTYSVDAAAQSSKLEVDADAFCQIIINIVDNAIKFTGKYGNPRLDLRVSKIQNENILISVRDYGPGIPSKQLKKIFELFYRPGNELTRETVGTGIGLALVKQLVTAMNGRVDALNSRPGAEFRITLPVQS